MQSEFPNHVREGDVLAGKYRVERILGVGGMGVVVAAQHMQLGQRVAIKFLLPHSLGNAEVVGRFLREAQAAARISSEHVARVLDVGNLENAAPYMVIEYLEGRDLGSWLTQKGVLPVEQAVDFVLQAIEALAEAHSLGIVHRDLKPANLYCIRKADGGLVVKVLDFGISKLQHRDSTGAELDLTRTTTVIGSPFYMSPEQLRSSRNVDPRTDIWSLGVILYQLVSGRPPFTAGGLPELVLKIATEPPPKLRAIRSEVPLGLEQVICKCLQKERARRYANVADLAVALAPFGSAATARASAERSVHILHSDGHSRLTLTPHEGKALSIPVEAAWGHTASPVLRVKRWLPLGLAACVGLVAAIALTWRLLGAPPTADPAGSRGPVTAASAPASVDPANVASGSFPTSASSPSASSPAADRQATPDDASPGADRQVKASTGASTAAKKAVKSGVVLDASRLSSMPPASASGEPECKKSYTLDKDGNAQFKPSCI